MPNQLVVAGASYGGYSVTGTVYTMQSWTGWTPTGLRIDTGTMRDTLGGPVGGDSNILSILYKNGNEDPRVLIAKDDEGLKTLPYSGSHSVPSISNPPGCSFRILAVVWGPALVTKPDIYDKLYSALSHEHLYVVNNESMGGDTWPGVWKSAAVFIRMASGQLRTITAWENGNLYL